MSAWIMGMGIIHVWRGLVLWRDRWLLFTLDSTLGPRSLAVLVSFFVAVGLSLAIAGTGLMWHKTWARYLAIASIPTGFLLVQVYIWGFVRSGLLWQRRWVALIAAIVGSSLGIGLLTWSKSRQYLYS
jgi:hypothetical protein